ncbi:MAG: amidohydrolase [Anaerolineae bacterium]|nr:amidohydrolase [Anaerolineae bacterium]
MKGLPEGPIIDCHVHMGSYANFFLPPGEAGDLIAMSDRLGISQICVSGFVALLHDYRRGNDLVLEAMRRYPGRFFGYIVVNPNYPDDVETELVRCWAAGMRGVKLHPSIHQYPLDGPAYKPAFAFAAAHRCPLLSHSWGTEPTCPPERFEVVARAYPDVPIILGHSGGGPWSAVEKAIAVARACPNVYLDLTNSRMYPAMVERIVEAVGAEQVLYGSDMPFLDPRAQLGRLAYSQVSPGAKRAIMGGNMLRLMAAVIV